MQPIAVRELMAAHWPFSLAVAVAVLLLTTLLLFFVWRKISSKGDTILLVGLIDSGKTSLFGKLIRAENVWRTYSSIKENTFPDYYGKDGSRYRLVDYPGADSLRKLLFSTWLTLEKQRLCGIIFVLDSSTMVDKGKDVAEFLYDVLYESDRGVPVLVACNKNDLIKAKPTTFVRDVLEKEFKLINVSREAALSATSGDSTKRLLSKAGADFKWSDLHRKLDFAWCNAVEEGGASFEQVQKWIDSL